MTKRIDGLTSIKNSAGQFKRQVEFSMNNSALTGDEQQWLKDQLKPVDDIVYWFEKEDLKARIVAMQEDLDEAKRVLQAYEG